MWRLGFFFHEMGFGLLSVFLPLYVVSQTVGGSLFDVGIMAAAALFLAIPASFFWGYLCDKTRHYKRFILLSFSASAILLYLFSLTMNLFLLITLYSIMSFLHVAHESPKNVLIAELYSRPDWEKSFAFYEGFTECGWLIGLILGFLASAYAVSQAYTLLLCAALNLVAFGLSLIFVADPLLVFERRLVGIEKSTDFACRGIFIASKLFDGIHSDETLRKENTNAFCCSLILFSLATSILFTPMPIFASAVVKSAVLPASFVFMVFVLNSAGGVFGYYVAGNRVDRETQKASLGRIVLSRSFLSFLLLSVALVLTPTYGAIMLVAILVLLGFANAIFLVHTLSISMELVPTGKAGLFNVLIGVGAACGSFIGPLIAAQAANYVYVFIVAGVIFFMAYVSFRMY
jgi:MFS family permease